MFVQEKEVLSSLCLLLFPDSCLQPHWFSPYFSRMTHGWSSFISGHRVSRSTSSSWRCIRLSLASLMHMTGDTLMRYRDMRFPDEKNLSKSFPHSLPVFCVILIFYPFPLIHSPNAYSPWVPFSFLFFMS